MASSAMIREDGSLLSRLDRGLFRLELGFGLIAGLSVFILMLLAVGSVGGRQLFNQPLPGYVDWIEQFMPVIAILAVAYTQRLGGHIRMDIFVGRLRGRMLWTVELITTFLVLVLVLFLLWGSWSHFLRSFDFAAPMWSRDSSVDIRLPIWPAKLIVPVAYLILSLRLSLQIWGYARAIRTDDPEPIGVPLIEDAATTAQREAETVSSIDNGRT